MNFHHLPLKKKTKKIVVKRREQSVDDQAKEILVHNNKKVISNHLIKQNPFGFGNVMRHRTPLLPQSGSFDEDRINESYECFLKLDKT